MPKGWQNVPAASRERNFEIFQLRGAFALFQKLGSKEGKDLVNKLLVELNASPCDDVKIVTAGDKGLALFKAIKKPVRKAKKKKTNKCNKV